MHTRKQGIIFVTTVLFAGVIGLFLGLSMASRFVHNTGLVDGRLRPCPDKPNCVCSEYNGPHAFKPLQVGNLADGGMHALRRAIEESGGEIRKATPMYLWATYTSPVLHSVDDVEARLDPLNHLLHLRSASRVGHSDFGANRKRLQQITGLFYRDLRQE